MTKNDTNTRSRSSISNNEHFGHKLVRLKTGEDIICLLMSSDKNPKKLILTNPMTVIYKRINTGTALVLLPWLPVELLESNEACVSLKDVLTVLEPNLKLIDHYENTVDKLLEVLAEAEEEQLRKPSIQEVMDYSSSNSSNISSNNSPETLEEVLESFSRNKKVTYH